MSVIDVEKLLEPISDEQPSGEDLEYDPEFGELERSSQGKPETQWGPGEEPNWREVRDNASGLFSRTKDLRVAFLLARALITTDGFPGFRDGLKLLIGLVSSFWETAHPELDPDDNDPIMRMNVLSGLCDPESMLRAVREAPLVEVRAFGKFSLRDAQVLGGQIVLPEGQEPPDSASFDAAFGEVELDDLQATADAVQESHDLAREIEDKVTDLVGASQAVSLEPLREVLREATQVLSDRLARRGVSSESPAPEGGESTSSEGGGQPMKIAGEISSREDVIRALDRICDYFSKQEPASPVPLLIERAKRLVGLPFLDIVRDLAPDGLTQVQNVAGITDE